MQHFKSVSNSCVIDNSNKSYFVLPTTIFNNLTIINYLIPTDPPPTNHRYQGFPLGEFEKSKTELMKDRAYDPKRGDYVIRGTLNEDDPGMCACMYVTMNIDAAALDVVYIILHE